MPSLFYKAAFERRFPLPYLFFEVLGIQVEESGGIDITVADLAAAIEKALNKCLPSTKISDKDTAYVSSRLEADAEEQEKVMKEAEATPEVRKKNGFATSFSDWVGDLSPAELCLVISEFDHSRASYLYTEVDRGDVVDMSKAWMTMEWERIKVGYESVVYGFGGGYDDKGGSPVVDAFTEDHLKGKVVDKAALNMVGF